MKCPNCGQEFEGESCPNCGRPARSRGGRIAAVIVAVLLVMPCAAFGACSVYAGIATIPDIPRGGEDAALLMLVLSILSLGGLVGLLYLVRNLWRG